MVRTRRTVAVAAGVLVAASAALGVPAANAATPAPTVTPTPTPSITAPAPLPVGPKLAITVTGGDVLTLPADDGFRDSTAVRIQSGASGRVDLVSKSAKSTIVLAAGIALKHVKTGWARTIPIRITAVTKGTWTLTARRTSDDHVRATAVDRLLVGSGKPTDVVVTPVSPVLYPYKDGVLDRVTATVTATDETGAALPVTGSSVLTIAKTVKHASLQTTYSTTAVGSTPLVQTGMSVVGLPLGTADLTTTVKGPAGKPVVAHTALTLAPTGVGAMRLATSSDTVQPVVDGLLDSVVLTPSGTASAGSPAPLSGSIALTQGKTLITTWPVTSAMGPVTWDGRVNGTIVPGTYTATLTLHGPEGLPRTAVKTITVSSAHLPYRVRDLFTVSAGNEQGLAVHNGIFYVAYDNGDGTARIEQWSDSGQQLPSGLNQLPIGHAAELAFSTTTNLLYAANGGATTPTMVWPINPGAPDGASAVQTPFDLSSLGPNGMVAVDDANNRLIVFAGTAGAYTISSVSLTAVTSTDVNGNSTTVPAGTISGTAPITISGTPQGIDIVGTQLLVYTSLKKSNHLAKFDLTNLLTPVEQEDLMNSGEGEGLATSLDSVSNVWSVYVGMHNANRIGILESVPDA